MATANRAPPLVGAPVQLALASYKGVISPELAARATTSGTVTVKLGKALSETNSPASIKASVSLSNHKETPLNSEAVITPSAAKARLAPANSSKSL